MELLSHYLFIQSSILLFITPFYLAFCWQKSEFKFDNLSSNSYFENFLSSRQANYLMFSWALLEAICWFVIPEFLLLLIMFLRVRNKRALIVGDILGTFIGTIIGLVIYSKYDFDLTQIPYIACGMTEQVKIWYQELGSWALFLQPFSGVPYKVFIHGAHDFDLNIYGFILLAIFVRVSRYYIFYCLFDLLYPLLHRIISQNYVPIFLLSCLVFSTALVHIYETYQRLILPI